MGQTGSERAQIQQGWCPYKEREIQTQRHTGEGRVEMGTESGVTHVQAQGRRGLLAAAGSWGRGEGRLSLQKEPAPATPGLRPPCPGESPCAL